jgi:nucleotide-binding universal stress UspA family protein
LLTGNTWRIQHSIAPRQAPQTQLVLGHDHHPHSQNALSVSTELARRLQAQLHVVHGIDLSDYPIDPDAADWEQQAQRTLQDQRQQVAEALKDCDTGWTYHAGRGDPVRLLATVAAETDALMIIVGTRGEGPGKVVARIFAHSVSHGLIARQRRPVLVVPHADEDADEDR